MRGRWSAVISDMHTQQSKPDQPYSAVTPPCSVKNHLRELEFEYFDAMRRAYRFALPAVIHTRVKLHELSRLIAQQAGPLNSGAVDELKRVAGCICALAHFVQSDRIEEISSGNRRRIVSFANRIFYDCSHSILALTYSTDEHLPKWVAALKRIVRLLDKADQKFYRDVRQSIMQGKYSVAELEAQLNYHTDEDGIDAYVDRLLGTANYRRSKSPLKADMHVFSPYSASKMQAISKAAQIHQRHVFYDLGAGTGRNAILMHLLTGCSLKLVEYQENLWECAKSVIDRLKLQRCQAINADVVDVDFSDGDIFYMFNPFGGGTMQTVEHRLAQLSLRKPLTIITVGNKIKWLQPEIEFGDDCKVRIYRTLPTIEETDNGSP